MAEDAQLVKAPPDPREALYLDNTRVSSFFECPRQYYFRHVLGWAREGTKAALAFGGAWHAGMDVIWGASSSPITDSALLQGAAIAFDQKWVEEGFSTTDINLEELRNPGLALEMFASYIEKYRNQIRSVELLAVEKPFIILLLKANELYPGSPPVYYIGRWDKAWRERTGRIYIGEHKTTALYRKKGSFAAEWIASFSPNNQVDGYAFSGYAVYGDAFKGVIIDGALVHKNERAFTRIPIARSMQNLDAWGWEIVYWVREILDNLQILKDCEDLATRPYLPAFPKRTEHCIGKYGACSFLDVCKYGDPNPSRIATPPEGFKLEVWDPFSHNMANDQTPAIIGTDSTEKEVPCEPEGA